MGKLPCDTFSSSNNNMMFCRQEASGTSSTGMRGPTRSKDPLRNLIAPRRTAPPSATSSRRVTQETRRAWRTEQVLGDLVKSLQVLDAGGQRPNYWVARGPGTAMTKRDHSEMERLRRVSREFVERHGDAIGASTGEQRAALVRLCGEGVGYEASRGDVVPFDSAKVSLPETSRSLDLCTAIPELEDWESWMIRDDAEFELKFADVSCYNDPALGPGSPELTALALRLWRLGLLKPVHRKGAAGFRMFAVAKGPNEQRLVFDARKVNRQFRAPPKASLGSPRALSCLDLSEVALDGDSVCGFYGDVPCMFYRLQGPSGLSEWLWLEGLDFESFVDLAVAEGGDPSEFAGCDGMGFTRLPMGFSWAPALAERSLEYLLDEAGHGPDALVLHGNDTAALERDRGVVMPYLDDFMGIQRGKDDDAAEEKCRLELERCRSVFVERGLDVHKDGVGQCFESLGVEVHLEAGRRRALPKREKFSTVLKATKCAASAKRLSPRQLLKVIGHWAWWLSLQPVLFSALSEVYAFGRCERDPRRPDQPSDRLLDVPAGVRQELRMLLKLAPFVRAELSWRSTSTC